MRNAESKALKSLYDLASPGKRLAGYFIDLSIVFVLMFLKGLIGYKLMASSSYSVALFYSVINNILLVLAISYFLFCDALPNGQSVGKRLLKMSVVGFPVNTKCTIFQSLLRNVPKVMFSILDAVFVFFGFRRRLGDMLAMTMVVNVK
ncbi:RDD family protein [Pseudomonas helvetica]|uniref:RDD family protein n=1 Tax=Pseudomonas helvetica TaxID=3136738 RepID=UPI003266E8D6